MNQTLIDQHGIVHALMFDERPNLTVVGHVGTGVLVCGSVFKWRHQVPEGDWAFLVVTHSDQNITCAVCLGSDLG